MNDDQLALLLQINNEPNNSFNYLQDHYPSGRVWDSQIVARLLRELRNAGMIVAQDNSPNKNHTILQPGLDAIEIFSAHKEKENQKEDLNYEKLNLEVETLRNIVFDYDETKKRTKTSLVYAMLATAIALISLILQWTCNKPH